MVAQITPLKEYTYCQKTFQNALSCVGTGLHTGKKVHLTVQPAPVNTGILFKRTDITDRDNVIPALYNYVADARLCSFLANGAGTTISTVEHIMGALSGLGISNAVIEVDGPEIPLMDGSAQDFVTLFECAGIIKQDAPLKALRVLKEVSVQDKNAEAVLSPAEEGLDLNFLIDFPDSSVIGRQEYSIALNEKNFKNDIAYARTFAQMKDIQMLRSMGLIQGGNLENALVVDNDKIVNPEGARSENEFVVHKVLDAVGDLYQLGMPVIGHFVGIKSGHALTNALLRKLMANKDNYEIVDMNVYMDTIMTEMPKSA